MKNYSKSDAIILLPPTIILIVLRQKFLSTDFFFLLLDLSHNHEGITWKELARGIMDKPREASGSWMTSQRMFLQRISQKHNVLFSILVTFLASLVLEFSEWSEYHKRAIAHVWRCPHISSSKRKRRRWGWKAALFLARSTSAAHVRSLLPWCAPMRGFQEDPGKEKFWEESRWTAGEAARGRGAATAVVSKKEGGSPSPPGLQKIQSWILTHPDPIEL